MCTKMLKCKCLASVLCSFFSPLLITEYKCSVILNDISLRQLPETAVFVCVCVLSSFKTVFKHKNAFSMHAPKTGRILLSLVRMYESFYTLVSCLYSCLFVRFSPSLSFTLILFLCLFLIFICLLALCRGRSGKFQCFQLAGRGVAEHRG